MAQNLSEAERLMAEMASKYGVSSKPVEQPIQAPKQVAPQPPPQPQSRGLIGDAMNLLGNRQKQIDKASGYACGGKIKAHAQGGKISGPGTPTSDSIPALVEDTGEPILVANKERIVSHAQDQFLESIATKMGFKSLDAMLEDGTGKPVGPTMKGGRRAARFGANGEWIPDEDYGNEGRSVPRAITKSNPGVVSAPGIASAPRPVITAESVNGAIEAPMHRSGGIFGTADLANQNDQMAKSLGYAGADDFNKQKANAPVGGIGILGEVAPGRTQADMDNTEKSRRWMAEDMMKRGRGGAAAAAQLMGLGTTERGQDAQVQMAGLSNEAARYGHDVTAQRAAGHDAVLMRGQDISGANEAVRAGVDRERLGIAQADSRRADQRFGIEKGILEGNAADQKGVRDARTALTAALASGDPKAIETAKANATAAGIKFDKPNNEFSFNANPMTGELTVGNKDTGAATVYQKGRKVVDIAAPGAQPARRIPTNDEIAATAKNRGMSVDAVRKLLGL